MSGQATLGRFGKNNGSTGYRNRNRNLSKGRGEPTAGRRVNNCVFERGKRSQQRNSLTCCASVEAVLAENLATHEEVVLGIPRSSAAHHEVFVHRRLARTIHFALIPLDKWLVVKIRYHSTIDLIPTPIASFGISRCFSELFLSEVCSVAT